MYFFLLLVYFILLIFARREKCIIFVENKNICIMKKFVLIALIALSSICFAQTKSILFIGNSYTYSNGGVDVMLKNIALAEGDTLETEAFTVG